MLPHACFFAVMLCAQNLAVTLPTSDRFPVSTYRDHVSWLADDARGGRKAGSRGGRDTADYIVTRFKADGLSPALADGSFFQEFPLENGDLARNVLAIVPGRGALAKDCIVVSAHYDHLGTLPETTTNLGTADRICNGADDNASGVAALLMIAADAARGARGAEGPACTILFVAFDAEEGGLHGSRYYVAHPAWPLEHTRAVLNFDMIGRLDRGTLYAGDAPSSPDFEPILEAVSSASGVTIETRFGGVARSDQAPFLEHGIPGIHFNTGLYPEYHSPADELKNVDSDGGATITGIGAAVLNTLAARRDPPPFVKLDPVRDVEHAIRLVTLLGAVPNVGAQSGPYLRVLFVTPGSPAARGGVRAGDELAAVNGQELTRIEDAVALIPSLRLERGVRLRLMRRGEPVDLLLPPDLFEGFLGPKVTSLPDGQYRVRFALTPPTGTNSVHVAGSFNDWDPGANPLEGPDPNGRFTVELTLPRGTYEYQFVLNGRNGKPDPCNVHRVGPVPHSVVWVGTHPSLP